MLMSATLSHFLLSRAAADADADSMMLPCSRAFAYLYDSVRRNELPHPRKRVPRMRLVTNVDPYRRFRAGHGAEEASLAVPLHARVPGRRRGARASPKLLPAKVSLVQGGLWL